MGNVFDAKNLSDFGRGDGSVNVALCCGKAHRFCDVGIGGGNRNDARESNSEFMPDLSEGFLLAWHFCGGFAIFSQIFHWIFLVKLFKKYAFPPKYILGETLPMKLYTDYMEFNIDIGKMTDSVELETFGLQPFSRLGMFAREEIPELIEFCKENPKYHIISALIGLKIVNRLDPSGYMFYLGDGDSDPDLIYSNSLTCGFFS